MNRSRSYLRKIGLSILALGLLLPLYLYASHAAGSRIDPVWWIVCTACFWLGILALLIARTPPRL